MRKNQFFLFERLGFYAIMEKFRRMSMIKMENGNKKKGKRKKDYNCSR